MRIGTAKARITPPVGSPLAGYSNRTSYSTGVHDDLYARVLVLDNEERRVAIVSCDLIGILRGTTEAVRNCGERIGLPRQNLMVCAYHNHSGPTPDLGYGGMGDYMSSLAEGISSAVVDASSNTEPVLFKHSTTEVSGLTINRRDPKGGPVDPDLVSLSWGSDGGAKGHLINFSCHAVVLGPDNHLISADYPGYLMKFVEGETGSTCLFTNGACGDINPFTDSLKMRMERGEDIYDRRGGTFREAEALGETLAKRAVESLGTVDETEEGRLGSVTHSFEAPVHPPAPLEDLESRIGELEELLSARQSGDATPDELYRIGLELSFTRKTRDSVERGNSPVEIQGILIGDVVLIGIPGEVFVEIGLKIKEMAAAMGLRGVVVELANDYLSYMPTGPAFEKGGYETEIATGLGYGPEIGDIILGGVEKVVEELGRSF